MFSVLVVHPTPTPGLALTLSRLVEAALSGSLADVAIADLCGDPLAQRLSEDGGCALKRVACAPAQAIAQAIGEARAGWVLLCASGLAPSPGWAQAARETLALAAAHEAGGRAFAGAFFAAPRGGLLGALRGREGIVLARRDVLAKATIRPGRIGRDGLTAARAAGRMRRIEGMCEDERG